MIKKLLLTAALLAPGLAYGQVSAPLNPPVTPAGQAPAPPPQAAAAGFTTLLANFDFANNQVCAIKGGSSTLTCVAATPTSNWIDCNSSSSWDTSKYAHWWEGLTHSLPCSNYSIRPDPVGGKQSLIGVVPAGSPVDSGTQLQTAHYASSTDNTGYITAPQGMYIESEYRIDRVWSNPTGQHAGSTDGIYLWQNNYGSQCWLDFQTAELSPENNGSQSSDTSYWCPSRTGGYLWRSYDGDGNIPSGPTVAHIYGGLRTTNGSNSYIDCAYVDNVLLVQPSSANGCRQNYSSTDQSGGRSFLIFAADNTVNSDVPTPQQHIVYNHWVRIWACNAAAATSGKCNGSTLTGSANSGAMAYWH